MSDLLIQYIKELIDVAREIYEKGHVSATEGNISVRIPGTEKILIKPTGYRLKDLTPNDIVIMNLYGNVVKGGTPSKEWRFHVGIYRIRKDVGAIIHAHPPGITAFATLGKSIPLLTTQAKSLSRKISLVKYASPGSEKLAKRVIKAFKDSTISIALLEKHGCVIAGSNLREAMNTLDLLEESAKVAILVSQIR